MRGTHIRIAALLTVLAVAGLIVGMRYPRRTAAIESLSSTNIIRACNGLLSVADFIRAYPSAAVRNGLSVRVDTAAFPTLLKCGVSITAHGAYTFYISVDVFRDATFALGRFRWRMEGVVRNSYYAITPGNVSGLGEVYMSYTNPFLGQELVFQRDHVYVEIAPSGGDLGSSEEIHALGRLLYERVSKLEPYKG